MIYLIRLQQCHLFKYCCYVFHSIIIAIYFFLLCHANCHFLRYAFYAYNYRFNTMKSKSAGRPRIMSEVLSNKKSRMDNVNASPSRLSSHSPILQPPSQQLQPPLQDTHPPLQTRPRIISEVLSNKKSHMDNLNASPSQLSLHAPILQPLSQPLQPPLPDTHVTQKRKVGRPRSQPQQQQVSTHDTTQANTMSNSRLTTSKPSGSKHGLGKSLGIKGWGSGSKLKVQFDVNNKPLGDEGNSLTGQLGIMVQNSYRVPLTYLNWKSIPNHIKEGIWKEVQDNLEFCPDEYESVCMDSYADPNIALRVPDFVDPDQWKELVEYWQIEEVAAEALRNKGNRSWRGAPHNTGRTPFSQIRYGLAANGESLDKMSVYLQTRRQDNPEVKEIMTEYNRQVELLSEDEGTIEARDRIFHSIVGKDNHGYCRTYGGGVSRSSVYKKDSGPSQTINPSSMAEIEQRIEARLIERFTSQFEKLQYHMFEYMESRGSEARQFPDIASGHRTVRDQSIRGDTPTLERGHRTPTHSPGPVEQRPRRGVEMVGDALSRYVPWNLCDVIEKEGDD
ncbi:hypothetical protein RHSIM_Rhsim07G0133200 [Rhododendron simsii]|uniref:Transposase n=1 Tax=Rhododendron simsii TaxID=118357 RepID=A0A834LI03_RHOSS|nr:hypothetical protein RHSIM_Rhsim07G0133200 [Rhododendron simsii]